MILLCSKNKQLYDVFKGQRKDEFRTLLYLLNGEEFDKNDKAILEEIMLIDRKINDLILNNKDLVKDDALKTDLANASAHFTIIDLAYQKKIEGECDRFVGFVYPRTLQEKLELEVKTLQEKLEILEKE
jgi:hypothetical protein